MYSTGRQYKDLAASSLFCSQCQQAVPIRQRLLLILPDGELYEYLCKFCGSSLGTKKVTTRKPTGIIIP